jgi:acetyltransferase-like isoleucine patch superfamily enzyme
MGAVHLNSALRDALRKRGFAMDGNFTGAGGPSSDLRIETPASTNALLGLDHRLHIGAFSHLNGGFIQNATIGRYCSFARDVQIGHGSHPTNWLSVSPLQYNPDYRGWLQTAGLPAMPSITPFQWAKHTMIGSDVWLGNGVFVQDGVTIGHGAIVGARSVVTHDVPPYAIVAGNPARLIRMRFPSAIIERLLQTEWWRYAISDFGISNFSNIHETLESIEAHIESGAFQEFNPPVIDYHSLHEGIYSP